MTSVGVRPALGARRSSLRTPGVQRAAIALVEVLGLSVWFSVTAVVPTLERDWQISSVAAVWLTGAVQLGFVAGAVGSTLLNLADRVRQDRLVASSAAAAALTTLVLALTVDGLPAAIVLRFLTGVCLAGVYPVGMKLMASWSDRASRGRAMGLLVGALTLGSILPQLIRGVGDLPWRGVLVTAALLGAGAAVLALAVVRPGPHVGGPATAVDPRYSLAMFRQRGPRLVNLGYFGHMWELYALWAWLPSFLIASPTVLPGPVGVVVFGCLGLAGAAGCLLGGWAADRFGRGQAASTALVISGACCLLSPLLFAATPWLLIAFCVVWGAAVIADSGVFSAALSESVDQRFVGTALTTQTAVGFAITVLSIQLVPLIAEVTGYRYALLVLALGPLIGAPAIRRFARPPTGRGDVDGSAPVGIR